MNLENTSSIFLLEMCCIRSWLIILKTVMGRHYINYVPHIDLGIGDADPHSGSVHYGAMCNALMLI